MEKILNYIYKKYGLILTKEEIDIVIKWYNENSNRLINEDILDKEISEFLRTRFRGKVRHVIAEDTSNMHYLLMLLKENTNR